MSSPSATISDELLYAYVDGELDAAALAQVEAAIADDPALAARVAQQRRLRARLQSGFAHIVDEPVPQRLQAAIAAPDRRWSRREWGAMAATLVLGALLGPLFRAGDDGLPVTAYQGKLIATGDLRIALSEQLSQQAGNDAPVGIGMSIRTSSGELCRSFALTAGQAGLACQRAGEWVVDVLAPASATYDGSGYRQAATSLPEPVRLAIEARVEGEPLTRAEETELRQSGWHAAGTSRD